MSRSTTAPPCRHTGPPGSLADARVYVRIEAVVGRIPPGRVASYGQIARIAHAATPRQVGYAMATLAPGTPVPWHRVLNSRGAVSARGDGGGAARQRLLLEAEGVVFNATGRVDFSRFGWDGPDWAWVWETGLARRWIATVALENIGPELLALLVGVGMVAGWVDAVAGGGGLVALPVLLSLGLPPVEALATTRVQGTFGTFSAAANYVRSGQVDLYLMAPAIAFTFAGAALGTLAVQIIHPGVLEHVIPVLLILIALYFLLAPRAGEVAARQRVSHRSYAIFIGTGIGFYDGFFGPGAGSFLAVAGVTLLGLDLARATAGAKVLNFTSNLTSATFFAAGGYVVWPAALAMGVGQLTGAWIGSHMVVKRGARMVRPVLVMVCIAMSIKLLAGDANAPVRRGVARLLGME